MNFHNKKGPALPEFQFTPMIDVVFLLLCFFVTTSVFSQWEMEVDVVLPSAQSSKMPDRLPGEVIINLSRDGIITINQQVLSQEELKDRLTRLVKLFPGQPVIIRADKDSKTESLIHVVDICRTADIWNISFATSASDKTEASTF